MFQLDLDLEVFFVPPMDERGRGIRLTRTIELPFCPYEGMRLCGKSLAGHEDSVGFGLQNVLWDVDRHRFYGETASIIHDLPLSFIPDDLRVLIDVGWRFGSFEDALPPQEDGADSEYDSDSGESVEDDFEAEVEKLPSLAPRKRPPEFNRLFRAIIRAMAESSNNDSLAYAMEVTGRFFSDGVCKETRTPAVTRFRDAISAFYKMSFDEQVAWRERVTKKYPRLDRIVAEHGCSS